MARNRGLLPIVQNSYSGRARAGKEPSKYKRSQYADEGK